MRKIWGRNPVLEALRGNVSAHKLLISKTARGEAIREIVKVAKEKGIPITEVDPSILDREAQNHQGVVLFLSEVGFLSPDDVPWEQTDTAVLLDRVEDPRNLGAIARSAECFGIKTLIVPARRSAPASPYAVKASAGALLRINLVRVANPPSLIKRLKEKGFWVVALETHGTPIWDFSFPDRVLLILGSEGKGISKPVLKEADFVVGIPLRGKLGSLNVSCAAAIAFYELSRQRMKTGTGKIKGATI